MAKTLKNDAVASPNLVATPWGLSAPTPAEYPYGPFGILQRHRYVDSSKQAIMELND